MLCDVTPINPSTGRPDNSLPGPVGPGIGGGHPSQGLPGSPNYPSQGLPSGGHIDNSLPGGGYPSQGLPGGPGHPSQGLPESPNYPAHPLPPGGIVLPPIVLPPLVGIWPRPGEPSLPPTVIPIPPGGGSVMPPIYIGGTPENPIVLPPSIYPPPEHGSGLPDGKAAVLGWFFRLGWRWAVVDLTAHPDNTLPPAPSPK